MATKHRYLVPVLIAGLLGSARIVHAHCPLCTATIGAGLLGAQYLGLGDSIVGVFAGAFAVATGLWFAKKIKTRYIPLQTPALVLASVILTLAPLTVLSDQLFFFPLSISFFGVTLTQAFFVSKLIFGGILGGIATIGALALHNFIKRLRGKVLIPFQSIAVTVLLLLITSGVLVLFFGGG